MRVERRDIKGHAAPVHRTREEVDRVRDIRSRVSSSEPFLPLLRTVSRRPAHFGTATVPIPGSRLQQSLWPTATRRSPVVSETLKVAIIKRRAPGVRQYQLARQAEINPSVLSAILNGIVDARPGDQRVIRLGQVLGLRPAQCFETNGESPLALRRRTNERDGA